MGFAAASCHVKGALVREGDVDDGAVDIAAVHVPEGVLGVVSGVELDEADAGGVAGGRGVAIARGATRAGWGRAGRGAMRGADSAIVREDLLEVTRGDVLREVGDAKDARGRGAIVPRARVEILVVALVVGIHLVVRPGAPSARSRRGFGTRRRRAATDALPAHPARATRGVPLPRAGACGASRTKRLGKFESRSARAHTKGRAVTSVELIELFYSRVLGSALPMELPVRTKFVGTLKIPSRTTQQSTTSSPTTTSLIFLSIALVTCHE